jgi:Mitochondrial 28S ribosomal protein S34
LSKDQNHGKVYGKLFWKGKEIPKIQKIGNTYKDEWKVVSVPNYESFIPDKAPPVGPPKSKKENKSKEKQ